MIAAGEFLLLFMFIRMRTTADLMLLQSWSCLRILYFSRTGAFSFFFYFDFFILNWQLWNYQHSNKEMLFIICPVFTWHNLDDSVTGPDTQSVQKVSAAPLADWGGGNQITTCTLELQYTAETFIVCLMFRLHILNIFSVLQSTFSVLRWQYSVKYQ